MAKPRVFISSTFYDLRQVRSDLERFVKDLGYEPVLNEFGNIPYGKDEKLEEYCYKEISNVDILVSIIGGRFGSESQNSKFSISQMEFRTAIELKKQVYIFIDRNVYAEHQTYLLNKESKEIKYRFADNIKIYEFIEFCQNLPNNNNIHSFETSLDIIQYLKEQWAGLFQRFLQEQLRLEEINILRRIDGTANTLHQLVKFLTEERKDRDSAIEDILLSNHPAMEQIRNLLSVSYRVYFTTLDELNEWLEVRGFRASLNYLFGDDDDSNIIYYRTDKRNNKKYTLKIVRDVFNLDRKLKVFRQSEWQDDFITLIEEPIDEVPIDEVPF
jgi:hypothetical protein